MFFIEQYTLVLKEVCYDFCHNVSAIQCCNPLLIHSINSRVYSHLVKNIALLHMNAAKWDKIIRMHGVKKSSLLRKLNVCLDLTQG